MNYEVTHEVECGLTKWQATKQMTRFWNRASITVYKKNKLPLHPKSGPMPRIIQVRNILV